MENSDQVQPLSCLLALDSGWNCTDESFDNLGQADGLFEDNLLELFGDVEAMDMEASAKANDGDSSPVMSEVDQPRLVRATWLQRDLPSPSRQENPLDVIADSTNDLCSNSADIGATGVKNCSAVGPSTSTSVWSSTSASEDSDDGSRSSFSTYTSRGLASSRGVSSPLAAPVCRSTDTHRHYSDAASPQLSCPRAGSTPGTGAATVTSLSPDSCGGEVSKNKRLPVKSGLGTPILPYTFAPAFGPPAGVSAVPSLDEFQFSAAFGAVGQALAAGMKRFRGGEQVVGLPATTDSDILEADRGVERARLLPHGTGVEARTKRSRTKEERLMKNREAANRSRIKRKEVLGGLENRVETLERDVAESRTRNASLQQEVASLRDQNSFLRGVIAASGSTADLPPILLTATDNDTRSSRENAPGGGGGAGTGANAVLGIVGSTMAVGCVALCGVCFGGRNGVGVSGGYGSGGSGGGAPHTDKVGGRRMLMSVDDGELEGSGVGSWFSGGRAGVGGYDAVGWGWTLLVFFVAAAVLVAVATEVYDAGKRSHRVGRGGSGGRSRRRLAKGTAGGTRRGLA